MRQPADDFTLIEEHFLFLTRMAYAQALGYGKEHRRAVAREDLRIILAFATMFLFVVLPLSAQTLLVASPTVIRANFSVVLNPAAASITTLSFTLSAVPNQVTSLVPTPGSATSAAGAVLTCQPFNVASGSTTCTVTSAANPVAAGTVANFSATVANNTILPDILFSLTGIVASGASGPVIVTAIIPPSTILTIQPMPGTFVVCIGPGSLTCTSVLDSTTVTYRTSPPTAPGPCPNVGSGAYAIDQAGFFYACVITDGTASHPTTAWFRSATPMTTTW